MSQNLDPLILDFLEWLAPGPRPYAEVMEAWRTSCPRLTIWEDSLDRGFVARTASAEGSRAIEITEVGRTFLLQNGRNAPPLAIVHGSSASPVTERR